MTKYIVVLVTGPSLAILRGIGLKLVKERLAACVNLVPRVESIFSWKGKICREGEALMMIKTSAARYQRLMTRIKQLHPYTVPEIIALPITKGSADYLKWIREMTR